MDDRRVGRLVRAARRRRGWRQADVEGACGIDQTTASLIERGLLDGLTVGVIRSAAESVGVRLEFEPRLAQGEVARLLDEGHARLVETVVGFLRRAGWLVHVEYTFNVYGERGSVDAVAWHQGMRSLLLVEVKTRLVDVQDLLSSFDRKCRLVPELLSRERGWRSVSLGRVIVVEEAATARRRVADHPETFDAALPARAREVRRWVEHPASSIAGLWFLSSTTGGRSKRGSVTSERVRRPSSRMRERDAGA